MIERFPGINEESCINCGAVYYGKDFIPAELPPAVRSRAKVIRS